MTRRIVAGAALLAVCAARVSVAFLAGGELDLSMDLVVNTGHSFRSVPCVSGQVGEPGDGGWRVSIHHPRPGEDLLGDGEAIRCGRGTRAGPEPVADGSVPWLIAQGELYSRLAVQMEDERLVVVRLSVHRTVNPPGLAEPVAGQFQRKLTFHDDRDVFVPLMVTGPEAGLPGDIREVMLRFTVRERAPEPETKYGVVWLVSEAPGATIYLDGGRIGEVPPGGDRLLRHVRAGVRTIGIGDDERELRSRPIAVEGGRTVMATLHAKDVDMPERPFGLVPMGPNDKGYEEYRRSADDAVVIRIPEGEFLMGNEASERSPLEHEVHLSEYLIDKTGVTWGQYKRFAVATGTPLPAHEPYWGIRDNFPAVYVSWSEASNYCHWAGGRLPTEAEREKAARGTDGRKFPWGDSEPTPDLAVFRKSWGYEGPGAVGQFGAGASPYGMLDAAGNVWEWCSDWYGDEYYASSPHRDPQGPANGIAHVVRGGSWDSRPSVLSSSVRSWGHVGYRDGDFGFRCAMNSPAKNPEHSPGNAERE